ncbi:MAG: beta-propeller domain-containing protein [Candidatus Omnitrophica bacterium]|nr:beta-propeller domain-containing protein [Candidatus Omnitrophota bacterium]
MFRVNYIFLIILILFLTINFSFACNPQNLKLVKFNESNQAVGELQRCLIKLGFLLKSGVTNFFGKETQQALKEFYKQMLKIDVDGKNFGLKGLNWFRLNYLKTISSPQKKFLIKVTSKEDLKKKLFESISYYDAGGIGRAPVFSTVFSTKGDEMSSMGSTLLSKQISQRYSETNVQVKGIDEPDIVKNDGLRIYFANNESFAQAGYPVKFDATVNIINAFPPKDLSLISKINLKDKYTFNELLLDKDNQILVVMNHRGITAYNITDPSRPEKIWQYEYVGNSNLLTARFYQGKIYLFLSTYLDVNNPCPLTVLNNNQRSAVLTCTDFYIPAELMLSNVSYAILVLEPKTGSIEKKISLVGSLDNSVIYVSPKNIYLTYYYYDNLNSYVLDFFFNQLTDILPFDIISKLNKLKDYDISDETKVFEINLIFNKYFLSLGDDKKFINEVNDRLKDYLTRNLKNLEKTAIVKIDVNDLEIKKTGYIPGRLLNQFSLDEKNDYLRTAVTLGERGFSFGPIWLNLVSSNAVYVLDNDLNIVGSLEKLGLNERIYSIRFYGDRGYLVTFRQKDPFYVLDLADPQNPKLKGELKIPGYSSYLEELENNLVLGIGIENFKVKISLFDVSNSSNPIELDKYLLDENWSEILENHRAFLKDERHKILFLPSYEKGYIFSYADKKLKLEKEVKLSQDNAQMGWMSPQIKRAIYIDDYLYIISENEINVLNENNWQEEAKLKLINN